ncbi:MAG TPA: DUF3043 domain-containing protein [Actinophytocola sp.]|uniref:DUF3043 domain-containing protein n=1 Tax=Actinophytocola sp. TaxID=1872138 RepID=UPI002DDCC1C3|nr:DUF3043 domain-containing protein [Actinophytocola sp.]HEV2780766.1 DUF3043 domain-containing protein [Actinophytocola sp.]
MRFLRRNTTTESTDAVDGSDAVAAELDAAPKGHTPGKGRPTPKRREAEARRRGPVPPPPRTTREAMRRARGSKEERKALAAKRREVRLANRQRMMSGDEKYLPARDRGPVKAYVRDLIDSRRNLLGLFMPLAILVFIAMLSPNRALQSYATMACLIMLLAMILEGVLNGRRFTRMARAKFPKENIRGLSLGWYAFIRASQIRRLRIPKPRVKPGDRVE